MPDRASDPLRVALKPAFAFECPRCGEAHFLRASPAPDADGSEAGASPPEAEGYTGAFVVAPATVECKACGVTFETEGE